MSWLRSSPLRASFSRQASRPLDAAAKCDPGACYESFCKHWQQAEEIILRSQGSSAPSHDDVLGVVSHLEHLVTLLLLEIRHNTTGEGRRAGSSDLGRGGICLEHLLSENLLEKLYEWGNRTGRYLNVVRLEQMKLYSLLVSHAGQQLLCAEPFLRPLLKLLCSFRSELPSGDVEGRLVCLLEQLCVVLMQNSKFVDLFFYPTVYSQDKPNSSFVPVTLLLSYVHREGPVGQQARAALLLCAAISAKNQAVAEFIAHRSNVCPVLATGLSGLYCSLPRFIDVTQPDWHRLTPDDVNDIGKLAIFMNSLEFCNAVAQVAHPMIQQQLLDFLYQGFLLPVMGPALLQDYTLTCCMKELKRLEVGVRIGDLIICCFLYPDDAWKVELLMNVSKLMSDVTCHFFGSVLALLWLLHWSRIPVRHSLAIHTNSPHVPDTDQTKRALATTRPQYLQSGVDEQIAAIAYFELVLRSVTEPGLLKSLVRFLLDNSYDEANILDAIVPLIDGEPRLSIVTISLFETLVDLNCEDLMLEMVLKYLIGGHHLMVSHRRKSLDCDLNCKATNMFLNLSPECCISKPLMTLPNSRRNSTTNSRKPSISSMDQNLHSLSSIGEQASVHPSQKTVNQAMYAYWLHSNESLYGNYHAYLCEARQKILSCQNGCKKWSSKYDGHSNGLAKIPNDKVILSVVKDFQLEHSNLIKDTSVTVENNENDEGLSEPSTHNALNISSNIYASKQEDSLQSIGESSGYDSFKYKSEDHHGTPEEDQTNHEEAKDYAEDSFWRQAETIDRLATLTHETDEKLPEKDENNTTPISDVNIGPLLKISLSKLGRMLDNDVYVNLRLTGLITRLAVFPLPLLRSFLLCPWIVLQPSITSLYQILVSLKQKIDESIRNESDMHRLIEEAQHFLIDREIRLSNARKNAIELTGSKNHVNSDRNNSSPSQFAQHGMQHQNPDLPSQPNSGNWEQQSTTQPLSINEPFKRNEPKRKSLSSSFTAMFTRKMNSGGISVSPTNQSQIENYRRTNSLPYSSYSEDNLWQSSNLRRIIVNAVILDEWLRELGALAQEHVVSSITDLMNKTNMENTDSSTAHAKIL